MVRPRARIKAVGPSFLNFSVNLNKQLENIHGTKIPFTTFSDGLAGFMQEEGLDKIIIRRAKYRKKHFPGGGFF